MQQGQLSARQREIGGLVASGRTNREIGELLNLSDRTVETHIAALFNKLGCAREPNSRDDLKPGFAQPACGSRKERTYRWNSTASSVAAAKWRS